MLTSLIVAAVFAQTPSLDFEIQAVSTGHRFVEGPAVSPDGRIYFSDIPDNEIHIFDPASGETSLFSDDSGATNGMLFFEGELYACEGGRRCVVKYTDFNDVASRVVLAESWNGQRFNSPNDLCITPDGSVHFTDPRYGNRDDMEMDEEAVYSYLPGNGAVVRQFTYRRPNGIALDSRIDSDYPNSEGRRIYIADHAGAIVHTAYHDAFFSLHSELSGTMDMHIVIDERRGGVDGMWVDADGRLYCTVPGMSLVSVWSAEGEEIGRIAMPEGPANCVVTPDGATFYVTARSTLYAVTLDWDE